MRLLQVCLVVAAVFMLIFFWPSMVWFLAILLHCPLSESQYWLLSLVSLWYLTLRFCNADFRKKFRDLLESVS